LYAGEEKATIFAERKQASALVDILGKFQKVR
jgi:hypothetical protein